MKRHQLKFENDRLKNENEILKIVLKSNDVSFDFYKRCLEIQRKNYPITEFTTTSPVSFTTESNVYDTNGSGD